MLQLYSLSERRVLDQPALTNNNIPPGVKWVLLLDKYRVEVPYYSRVAKQAFELITLSPGLVSAQAGSEMDSYPRLYDLSKHGTRQIHRSGFHEPEESSVWTAEPIARVYFDTPALGQIEVTVKAHAYGPNIGRTITIKIGGAEKQVKFYAQETEVKLTASLTKPADYLEFSGMLGTSPAQFEHAPDPRLLGIAISSISIARADQPAGRP